MSDIKLRTRVIGVLGSAVLLASASAHAGETFKKEAGVGMGTGAAMGAVVGGPVGAAVGFMVGGILGDTIGTANRAEKHAQVLVKELDATRVALAQAQTAHAETVVLAELAQRLRADVLFRTNSAQLDASAATELSEVGAIIGAHPALEVELHGFADPRGKADTNLQLSEQRAQAVLQALVGGGASESQIRIAAHGEQLTTAPKGDLEAYAWERRVTMAVLPRTPDALAQVRQ